LWFFVIVAFVELFLSVFYRLAARAMRGRICRTLRQFTPRG